MAAMKPTDRRSAMEDTYIYMVSTCPTNSPQFSPPGQLDSPSHYRSSGYRTHSVVGLYGTARRNSYSVHQRTHSEYYIPPRLRLLYASRSVRGSPRLMRQEIQDPDIAFPILPSIRSFDRTHASTDWQHAWRRPRVSYRTATVINIFHFILLLLRRQ